MHLKELELRGFKSFAQATTLRFEPGITAVVGPNGSGKSNIVDALAWVMGEQGAKALRGSSMEDVIFAGTSSRPPLGRAQVSLTIDNSDHALDIDYSEVSISRTIYRSGGSEYAINGTPARLIDVQDLLSDAGLGSQMHVIIGQGRLDQILRADPAGHRAIIEEAAGILKYRKRKERSLRKLKAADDNLARLDDLLTELRRQLGPLGRQAKVSRRADGIHATVLDATRRLLADDSQQLIAKRTANDKQLSHVRAQLLEERRGLARTKMRIEQLEAASNGASPEITRLSDALTALSQVDGRYGAFEQVAAERRRQLESAAVEAPIADPDVLEKRALELDRRHQETAEAAHSAQIAQEEATKLRAAKEAQLAALRQTIVQLRHSEKEQENALAHLRELIARQDTMLESSAKRFQDFQAQKAEVEERIAATRADIDRLGQQAQQTGTESGGDGAAAQAALEEAQRELADLRGERDQLAAKRIRCDARADALKDTVEARRSHDAIGENGVVEPLGGLSDFIAIEPGWEDAVAAALGAFSDAVVVESGKDISAALDYSQARKAERLALIVPSDAPSDAQADSVQAHGSAAAGSGNLGSGNPVDSDSGVLSAASLISPANAEDLASCRVSDSVRLLLDGVGVASDRQQAMTALAAGAYRLVVTAAAEILSRSGAVTAVGAAPNDLSLTARRNEALAQSAELSRRIAALDVRCDAAQKSCDEAEKALQKIVARQEEAKLAAQRVATELELQRKQLAEALSRSSRLDESLESVQADQAQARAKRTELAAALEEAQRNGTGDVNLEDFEKREQESQDALTDLRAAEAQARLKASEQAQQRDSFARQAEALHNQAAEAIRAQKKAREQQEARRRHTAKLEQLVAVEGAARTLLQAAIADVRSRRDAAMAQAAQHNEELSELRAKRDAAEKRVDALAVQERDADIERERYATQYGQLMQTIADRAGLSMDDLIAGYGPSVPVPVLDEQGEPIPADSERDGADEGGSDSAAENVTDASAESHFQTVPYVRDEQKQRLKKAQAELAKLGKVNPLASEEYDALEERRSYLAEQRDDVARSRDDLLKIVRNLDTTMQETFKSAFDDVEAAFEKMFALLFPGGHGRLRLENPNDLLTTGVIVEASPAGKKVRQLSLLSGGEKSLAALALLFAVFTARPSPFYVMDEVEAALDDLNLTRLLNALNQLRSHAQLIIITHQQRTMAIADALYGVTMRADGVTAVVSQKLEHRASESTDESKEQQ